MGQEGLMETPEAILEFHAFGRVGILPRHEMDRWGFTMKIRPFLVWKGHETILGVGVEEIVISHDTM